MELPSQMNLDNLDKDKLLSQLEKAANSPLLKNFISKICDKIKSRGWTDYDAYKTNCNGQVGSGSGQVGTESGAMICQVILIVHYLVFIINV